MLPIRRILFPVDFSERCYGAAQHAEWFTSRFGAELILLTVAEPYLLENEPLRTKAGRMGQLTRFLPPGFDLLDVRYEVLDGDAGKEIVNFAARNEVDLIMMPTHGYGTFRRFLLGSVTAKVLHDSPCAVWTDVHAEHAPPVSQLHCREIICGVELRKQDLPAIAAGAELAKEFGGRLTVVHAVQMPAVHYDMMVSAAGADFLTAARDNAREQLRDLLADARVVANVCVGDGTPAGVLAGVVRQRSADLLIIGRSQAAGIMGRLRADGYSVIHHSPCPVLSV